MLILALGLLSSCARDLSSNMYTSDSTLSLTMIGRVISARPVTVKNTDSLGQNGTGIVGGAFMGGAAGGLASNNNSDRGAMIVGGAVLGSLVGAVIERSASKAKGIEYIIKIDTSSLTDQYYEGTAIMRNAVSSARTSGILTIVQGQDNPLEEGQEVYVILSPNRARVIAKNKGNL